MNHTQKYRLSQWEGTDRILMEDFNSDNLKLETALAAQAAASTKLGNCQIWTTTYTGDGQYGDAHPTRISFPAQPVFVAIMTNSDPFMLLHSSSISATYFNSNEIRGANVSWNPSKTSVSLVSNAPTFQMNHEGKKYFVIALLAKS